MMFDTLHIILTCLYKLQEIARHLRPRTLRAQFGRTKIENAVHCTDLPEDGLLEVRAQPFLPLLIIALTVLTVKVFKLNTIAHECDILDII